MNKLLLFGFLIMSQFANAQGHSNLFTPEVFRGVLYDLQTGQHLEGASVMISCDNSQVSTMTDENGYFYLSGAPKSCFKVTIKMTGFEDKVLENINRVKDVEYYIGLEQQKVQQPKRFN